MFHLPVFFYHQADVNMNLLLNTLVNKMFSSVIKFSLHKHNAKKHCNMRYQRLSH